MIVETKTDDETFENFDLNMIYLRILKAVEDTTMNQIAKKILIN